MHAFGAAAKLADGLRTAQHQDTKDREFPPAEVQKLAEPMAVLFDAMASSADTYDESLILQEFNRSLDRGIVKIDDRIAARFLIARVL